MVHKTRGIVLRTVKYGETSLICTMFTELFGLQSYMVKGVRSSKKRRSSPLYPGALLDMVVYQQPNRNLQQIREYAPYVLYESLHEDVVKNGVALFALEVAAQLLTAQDAQPELYRFLERYLITTDHEPLAAVANFPLYFLIQAGKLSGYYISGTYTAHTPYADIHEGRFAEGLNQFPPFIEGTEAALMSLLNQAGSYEAIKAVKMSGGERKKMLQHFIAFLQLHVPHFRELRTLQILTAILY